MEKNRIKICHVANNDSAIKFLLLPQLRFLIKSGYDVSVACTSDKWTEEITKEGIRVKNIKIIRKISPFYDLITLIKLSVYFRHEKFDIVHTHNPKPGLLGQLAARLAGVPIVINTIHGLYFDEKSSNLKRRFFIFMEKIAAHCSDLIFSQNREDIETIIKEKITKPEKIQYLGNGVDINKFNPERFSKDSILKKKKDLGIPPDFFVLGIVARLVKEKGYIDLFNAFKIVLKDFPKTILLSIGPKDLEKKDAINPGLAKDYGIENNVMFLGQRTDLEELYPIIDVFTLPSYREGMPRSILEAMASGKPVVATNIRGCKEIIENGKTGILVPAGSSAELAKAINYLLANKDKAEELGNNGRIKAMREFDENMVFNRIKAGYDKIIKEKIK